MEFLEVTAQATGYDYGVKVRFRFVPKPGDAAQTSSTTVRVTSNEDYQTRDGAIRAVKRAWESRSTPVPGVTKAEALAALLRYVRANHVEIAA